MISRLRYLKGMFNIDVPLMHSNKFVKIFCHYKTPIKNKRLGYYQIQADFYLIVSHI